MTKEEQAARSLQYVKKRQARYIAEGLCPCGREKRDGRFKCQRCADTHARWYQAHKEEVLAQHKQAWVELKQEVMSHYGGKCACCGEDWIGFLQLDHINNGGTKHRAEIKKETGSTSMYHWIKKNGFPTGFQVLCANCNFAKWNGTRKCLHELIREDKSDLTCAASTVTQD